MISFHELAWLGVGVEVLLAVAVVLWVRTRAGREEAPRLLCLSDLVVALTVVGAAAGAKLALQITLAPRDRFGLIHLVYLDLVVVLPLVGLLLLLVAPGRPRATRPLLLAVLAACAMAPVGAYASFVEPFALRLERARIDVPAERAGDAPLRVGVLADIQTARVGAHEHRAVERVMALRPDVIVLPGDLYQGPRSRRESELPKLRALLGRLRAPGGVYFVLGDADSRKAMNDHHTRRALAGTGVRLLVNQTARVRVRDRELTLGGIELDWRTREARATVRRLAEARGGEDVRLLLSHRPDVGLSPEAGPRIDLTVAGHTHGGQVQVPFYGPPSTASSVPRAVGAGGLHVLGGRNPIYVSRGVGLERGHAPRIRFLAPPEVSLLEIGERRGATRAEAP